MEHSLLKAEIDRVKTAAERLGFSLNHSLIGQKEDIAFLFNEKANKAAILALEGQVEEIGGHKLIVVLPKTYKVDLKQWAWFLNEGFTANDIAGQLFDDVFVPVSPYYLLEVLK